MWKIFHHRMILIFSFSGRSTFNILYDLCMCRNEQMNISLFKHVTLVSKIIVVCIMVGSVLGDRWWYTNLNENITCHFSRAFHLLFVPTAINDETKGKKFTIEGKGSIANALVKTKTRKRKQTTKLSTGP